MSCHDLRTSAIPSRSDLKNAHAVFLSLLTPVSSQALVLSNRGQQKGIDHEIHKGCHVRGQASSTSQAQLAWAAGKITVCHIVVVISVRPRVQI